MNNCAYTLCIYNENCKCILDEIEISAAGYCDSCIIPDFPESVLKSYKKKLLDKFTAIYAEWNKKDR